MSTTQPKDTTSSTPTATCPSPTAAHSGPSATHPDPTATHPDPTTAPSSNITIDGNNDAINLFRVDCFSGDDQKTSLITDILIAAGTFLGESHEKITLPNGWIIDSTGCNPNKGHIHLSAKIFDAPPMFLHIIESDRPICNTDHLLQCRGQYADDLNLPELWRIFAFELSKEGELCVYFIRNTADILQDLKSDKDYDPRTQALNILDNPVNQDSFYRKHIQRCSIRTSHQHLKLIVGTGLDTGYLVEEDLFDFVSHNREKDFAGLFHACITEVIDACKTRRIECVDTNRIHYNSDETWKVTTYRRED